MQEDAVASVGARTACVCMHASLQQLQSSSPGWWCRSYALVPVAAAARSGVHCALSQGYGDTGRQRWAACIIEVGHRHTHRSTSWCVEVLQRTTMPVAHTHWHMPRQHTRRPLRTVNATQAGRIVARGRGWRKKGRTYIQKAPSSEPWMVRLHVLFLRATAGCSKR